MIPISEIPRHVYNKAACQIGYAFGEIFTYNQTIWIYFWKKSLQDVYKI